MRVATTHSPGSIFALLASALLFLFTANLAHAYTYDVATEKPWTDGATTVDTSQTVQVRAYVPGSHALSYRSMTVYSSNTTAGSNSLGDTVGYVYNIYGTSPAWFKGYDGTGGSINYPTYQVMRTRLNDVNDDRLAVGEYVQVGASTHAFVYDHVYSKFTQLDAIEPTLMTAVGINNAGQVIGAQKWSTYNTQQGYVYDCQNGRVDITVPGAAYTIPQAIDEAGNIYGTFSHPDLTETYFIAHPETDPADISCSLVGWDDTFKPVKFRTTPITFELDGDVAHSMVIADFNGRGKNDILVDYGEYTVVLYKAESKFTNKKKYTGMTLQQVIDTYYPDVEIPTFTDVNNDGIDDEINTEYIYVDSFSLGKGDGTFYYVPQALPAGTRALTDINNDGYLDIVQIDGQFVNVYYQRVPVTTTTTVTDPAPTTEPAPTDTTTVTDPAPVDTTVTDPAPVDTTPTDPAPTEPDPADLAPTYTDQEAPYAATLNAAYPGMTLVKISIEDDGSADFKITFAGETIEGFMSSATEITEIAN